MLLLSPSEDLLRAFKVEIMSFILAFEQASLINLNTNIFGLKILYLAMSLISEVSHKVCSMENAQYITYLIIQLSLIFRKKELNCVAKKLDSN